MLAKENPGWFIVSYRVPSSPSTARVTAWKRTKELGALLLQQSVYILPNLSRLKEALDQLREQIQQFGGECRILEMASLAEAQQEEIIDEFNRLRSQEYEEVIEEGQALLQEIDRESKAGKFNFAELEETEKRLQKLKEWFHIVVQRDFFGSDLQEAASKLLRECEDRSGSFSQEVFSREETAGRSRRIVIPALQSGTESKRDQLGEKLIYSKDRLIARLKEVVGELENDTLRIDGERVSLASESAALELKYKTRKGRKCLEIDMEW
ncbi:MAG: hypothetical protein HYX90_00500 [Chloroflexi bacterium]|nr:hypothetical protein [Chloroflexota bacterium]